MLLAHDAHRPRWWCLQRSTTLWTRALGASGCGSMSRAERSPLLTTVSFLSASTEESAIARSTLSRDVGTIDACWLWLQVLVSGRTLCTDTSESALVRLEDRLFSQTCTTMSMTMILAGRQWRHATQALSNETHDTAVVASSCTRSAHWRSSRLRADSRTSGPHTAK